MDTPLACILAATDLSAGSDAALRSASLLAAATGAALHVIHALEFGPDTYAPEDEPPASFPARLARAQAELAAHVRRTVTHVEATCTTVIDLPHRAILARADEIDADLIVLGPHRRCLGDRVLGTTADAVIRGAGVPCLIARQDVILPLRLVVAAVDGSWVARDALHLALDWGRALGPLDHDAEVHAVHVATPPRDVPEFPIEEATAEDVLNGAVEGALDRLAGAPRPACRRVLLRGSATAAEITAYAATAHADLLVLGTRGHRALERLFLGSVTAAVAPRAPCPVLLVPPVAVPTAPAVPVDAATAGSAG